jgi:hypothetical protein
MAVSKVNEIISEVLMRANQIETEDGTFMELEKLRQWAAALQDANDAGPDVIERGDSVRVEIRKPHDGD